MIFDTDVLIWVHHGNEKAAKLVDDASDRLISIYTYMELFQGTQNKQQHARSAKYLKDAEFRILPLTESIGHRAAVYIEEYALSQGLKAGDALIAATATEHGMVLCTGNAKHFGMIKELRVKVLRP